MTKISIITPTHNAEKFIQKNINSVISQQIDNLEHILVDSISSDNTLKIVKSYKDHFSTIIVEKDKGIYDGMNKGIIASKGELIGILNADDYYNDQALNLVLKTYELSSKRDIIIYGDMFNEFQQTRFLSRGNLTISAFKTGEFQINHPTVFVSKSLYDRIGLFDINYESGADRDFVLRAYHNKAKFIKINNTIATFSLGGFTSSYSLRLIMNRAKEEFKILKKYYSRSFAIKKSLKQFYRMFRNNLLYHILGRNNFLKNRIKWLKKKDE